MDEYYERHKKRQRFNSYPNPEDSGYGQGQNDEDVTSESSDGTKLRFVNRMITDMRSQIPRVPTFIRTGTQHRKRAQPKLMQLLA